jgi:hypothetical protein
MKEMNKNSSGFEKRKACGCGHPILQKTPKNNARKYRYAL